MKENRRRLFTAWLLACLLLITSGVVYRVVAVKLDVYASTPIELPVPLKNMPMEHGNWRGQEVPISDTVLKVAGNDDHVSRFYRNAAGNQGANVYVAYTARPRTMRGHRPQVCYPNSGWTHDGTEKIQIQTASGRAIPCLLHRFYRPSNESVNIYVLNFYVVNGLVTDDESVFDGIGWRTPNIGGDAARYVAQIQISSLQESAVRAVGRDLSDVILEYLPDEEGNVGAADTESELSTGGNSDMHTSE